MERIKILCRLLCIIACTIFVCSFLPNFYAKTDASQTAYEDFNTQLQPVMEQLHMETDVYPLTKEQFQQDLTSEDVRAYLNEWLNQSTATSWYGEETMVGVTDELVQLYQNQKAIAKDELYGTYTRMVRMASGIMAVLLALIVMVIAKKKKLSQTKKEETTEKQIKGTKEAEF